MKKICSILLLAVALTGCASKQPIPVRPPIVAPTPTEAQLWTKAVDYFGAIETARHAGNQLALSLSRENKIPVGVLKTFVAVNQITIEAVKLMQASPHNFGRPTAVQVAALAGQILANLAQWNSVSAVTTQPKLSESMHKMEDAAIAVRRLQ